MRHSSQRFAQRFQTVAVSLDIALGRIVKRSVVADVIVFVVVIDVHLLRRGAGPKPVHLEVVVAPGYAPEASQFLSRKRTYA
jgi:hypothetical protein